MTEPIRVLQVVASLNAGGMENYIMNLYRMVDKSKVQFDFVVHHAAVGLYEDEIHELGGKIYHFTVLDDKNVVKYISELNRFFDEHKEYQIIHGHLSMDNYLIAFLHSYDYTENCYSCKFATLDRVSDITLGDSWGTELSGEVKNGVSLILCQSEKGKELIESAGLNLLDVDINNAISHNEQLNKPSKCSKSRDQFFENYNRYNNFGKALVKTAPGIVAKEKVKSIVKYIVRGGGGDTGLHDYSKRR